MAVNITKLHILSLVGIFAEGLSFCGAVMRRKETNGSGLDCANKDLRLF